MKIYLAARYSRLLELRGYREELERLGHTVTSRWLNGDHRSADEDMGTAETAKFADEDIQDVMSANWVISFTEPQRAGPTRGGRHVEFGVALAFNKRLIVVGHRENIFHCLPEVEFFEAWPEVVSVITAGEVNRLRGAA